MGHHVSLLKTARIFGTTVPAFLLAASLGIASLGIASAQTGSEKPQDQGKAAAPAAAAQDNREAQKRTDEFAEAAKAINGPAGNPECVWLGRRVVNLMWRDDLDTAFRHLDLYDRFGCPGGHVQAAFRCLVRFGATIDNKIPDTLNTRIQACWINPSAQPQDSNFPPPASPPPPPAAAAPAKGAPAK
ncbi:Beta-1-3, beta-1-6-glucan biosynthesis protein OS=Afipia felis OX=1035 GN=NCTC12722_02155 PE=4 SV=1 [Afipia felis]